MSSMCMYQGLGQMLTMCLQHHQGCSETPKCAYVIYGQPLIHNYPLSNYPSPKTNIVNGAHCYHTYCSSWKLRLCRRIASECMRVISSGHRQCVSVVSLFIGSVLLLPIIDTGYWPLTQDSSQVNISRIR